MSLLLQRMAALLALVLAGLAFAGAAMATPDDPPGRVGRLSDTQGAVWLFDTQQGQWVEAQRNRSLTTGDRLSTERSARAEVRVGSTELRLSGGTELVFERLDDERMVFQLRSGSLALRVRSREIASEVEVRTDEGRLLPERSGHYRIDREDDTTYAAPWRGSMRFESADQTVQVPSGRRAEFFRQPRDNATVVSWSNPENDAFSDWVARDEQRDDRSASQRYVSPEMTGADDLDRYGRWERHPDYGMVWSPMQVAVGWAPYRHGRWAWQVRWGWTWIDDAPWGFAPFHYGRWVNWGGRWCWSPGAYVARPAYAPALVAWAGGPSVGISINLGGGPAVGWVPLAPHDVYVPSFRYGPRYYQQVNRPQHPHLPPQVPTGPVMYGNHGVPGAVTVVPSNVLLQRQPVAPAAARDANPPRPPGAHRFHAEGPASPPTRVVAVPGGAQPVSVPSTPGREHSLPGRQGDGRREHTQPVAPAQPQGRDAPRGFEAPSPTPPVHEARDARRDTGREDKRQRTPESRHQQRERQGVQ